MSVLSKILYPILLALPILIALFFLLITQNQEINLEFIELRTAEIVKEKSTN